MKYNIKPTSLLILKSLVLSCKYEGWVDWWRLTDSLWFKNSPYIFIVIMLSPNECNTSIHFANSYQMINKLVKGCSLEVI